MKKQALNRTEFSRAEMMHVQNFRDKIEYNKSLILLPPEHPEYMTLISDFSLRLNPEDVAKLNAIDGVQVEEEEKPDRGNSIHQSPMAGEGRTHSRNEDSMSAHEDQRAEHC